MCLGPGCCLVHVSPVLVLKRGVVTTSGAESAMTANQGES